MHSSATIVTTQKTNIQPTSTSQNNLRKNQTHRNDEKKNENSDGNVSN